MKPRPTRRNSRLRRPFLAAPHPSALAPPVPPSRPAPFAPISTSTATSTGGDASLPNLHIKPSNSTPPLPPTRSATPSPPASPSASPSASTSRPQHASPSAPATHHPRDELDGAAEFLVPEISMSDIEAASEDGVVDDVLRMIDEEEVTRAPIQKVDSTDLDRICAGMRSASWVDTLSGQSTAPSIVSAAGDVVDAAEDPECEGMEWCHKEDFVIMDVFTSVTPERQRQEMERRLPKRKWTEVTSRYRVICNELSEKERSEGRRAMQKTAERRLKPSGVIAKQGAKTR